MIQAPGYKLSPDGVAIDAGAEGSVAQPKTAMPPGIGAFAHIIDTEGNRVELRSAA